MLSKRRRFEKIMEYNTETMIRLKDILDDQLESLEGLPLSFEGTILQKRMEKRLVGAETAYQYLLQAQLILDKVRNSYK